MRSICTRSIWLEKKKEDEANTYKEMEQVGKDGKKVGPNCSSYKEPIFSLGEGTGKRKAFW